MPLKTPHTVAALYVRTDSIYRSFEHVDCWDAERDAKQYPGPFPIVAHPPCGQWGRLARFARPNTEEKALAELAVRQVETYGGVLEHPAGSRLWQACDLPQPGPPSIDQIGFTLAVEQLWWGHQCRKRTWLYIVGADARNLPPYHFPMRPPTHVIGGSRKLSPLKAVLKSDREKTPPAFAAWLVALASRCKPDTRVSKNCFDLAGKQSLAAGQSPVMDTGDAR